jgi:hypothetical protein
LSDSVIANYEEKVAAKKKGLSYNVKPKKAWHSIKHRIL